MTALAPRCARWTGQPTRDAAQAVADRLSRGLLAYEPWHCACGRWHVRIAWTRKKATR